MKYSDYLNHAALDLTTDIGPRGWKSAGLDKLDDATKAKKIAYNLDWIRGFIGKMAKALPEVFTPDAELKFERVPVAHGGPIGPTVLVGGHVFSSNGFKVFCDETDPASVEAAKAETALRDAKFKAKIAAKKEAAKAAEPKPEVPTTEPATETPAAPTEKVAAPKKRTSKKSAKKSAKTEASTEA